MKVGRIIKAQQNKKESGSDLECYERIERHEIWNDVGRVNLTWQVWEKTKKNLSASPISLYNRYHMKIMCIAYHSKTWNYSLHNLHSTGS
jgi:hypothetical protein